MRGYKLNNDVTPALEFSIPNIHSVSIKPIIKINIIKKDFQ